MITREKLSGSFLFPLYKDEYFEVYLDVCHNAKKSWCCNGTRYKVLNLQSGEVLFMTFSSEVIKYTQECNVYKEKINLKDYVS